MDKIKIAIIDDHKIVRDGIKALLIGNDSIELVAESEDAEHFLTIIDNIIVDVVIVDMNLPNMDGVQLTKIIREKRPGTEVLILSAVVDEDLVLEAVQAGAKGYLSKDTGAEIFIEAIHSIAKSEEYFEGKISKIIFKSHTRQNQEKDNKSNGISLTKRETEVLICFAEGLSYKEIADKLFISTRTVEAHKNNILQKLELSSLADLIKYAIKNNIIKL